MTIWMVIAGILAFVLGTWGRMCIYYEMTDSFQTPSIWKSGGVQVGTWVLTTGFSVVFAFIAAGWVRENYGEFLGAFSFGAFLFLQWAARGMAAGATCVNRQDCPH
ncbi:hypothetical protein [Pontixanthobacter gangjinensis]|uniref:Uncharacterized protein n=1 Tax=Pontixanthobacter gangjinensis TaxID=1028742 RepID=A0A6I4SMU1_9SPHN|nr:hypothetical protein [Pontixanthobacter gangjinensis]MXO57063.1 hypothetical protein [Pontixanthobacter gangjinensis]